MGAFTILQDNGDSATDGDVDSRPPRAQACFNMLVLPAYSSAAVLKSKLLLAMVEGSGALMKAQLQLQCGRVYDGARVLAKFFSILSLRFI